MTKSQLNKILLEYGCTATFEPVPICTKQGRVLQEMTYVQRGNQRSILASWSMLSKRTEDEIRQLIEETIARLDKVAGCIQKIVEVMP